mmetsp:Transcript_1605/g.2694  ORF Transcript_1605/g.2694 Transcript_1605/m.2694 type:complete len:330 (-) Transcript_1605:228-1217(-)
MTLCSFSSDRCLAPQTRSCKLVKRSARARASLSKFSLMFLFSSSTSSAIAVTCAFGPTRASFLRISYVRCLSCDSIEEIMSRTASADKAASAFGHASSAEMKSPMPTVSLIHIPLPMSPKTIAVFVLAVMSLKLPECICVVVSEEEKSSLVEVVVAFGLEHGAPTSRCCNSLSWFCNKTKSSAKFVTVVINSLRNVLSTDKTFSSQYACSLAIDASALQSAFFCTSVRRIVCASILQHSTISSVTCVFKDAIKFSNSAFDDMCSAANSSLTFLISPANGNASSRTAPVLRPNNSVVVLISESDSFGLQAGVPTASCIRSSNPQRAFVSP